MDTIDNHSDEECRKSSQVRTRTPLRPHFQPRTRSFDADYETVPHHKRIQYCIMFSLLTHASNFVLGLTLSSLFWACQPWWWVEISFIICAFMGHTIHWLGHQKESGRWFRAHTMQHHILLYPPQRYIDNQDTGSSDPNAKFYYPVLATAGIVTYIATGSLLYAVILFLHTGLSFLWLDYLHTGFHHAGFRLEKYEWFIALRELHYLHHKGEMQDNLAVIDFFTDFLIGSFALGIM